LEKDIGDLNSEERLVRKLKKGKITVEEFNKKMKEYEDDDFSDIDYEGKIIVSKAKNTKKR